MADGSTPNYAFVLPEVGASRDTWGTKLNANFTSIDTLIAARTARAAAETITGAWSFTAKTRQGSTGAVGLGTDVHPFQIGSTAAANVAFSGYEIQSRNNGAKAALSINPYGGQINLGDGTNDIKLNPDSRASYNGSLFLGAGMTATPQTDKVSGVFLNVSGHVSAYNGGGGAAAAFGRNNTGTVVQFFYFGTQVGSIGVTSSATSYNTSSDYRLKENLSPVVDALSVIDALEPTEFNFKADPDNRVVGFIAHELQAVVPNAVSGTKDEVDETGAPVHQGVDHSKLVPLLVAAIQELTAQVRTLQEQVAKQ